jgi:hypothetical protein
MMPTIPTMANASNQKFRLGCGIFVLPLLYTNMRISTLMGTERKLQIETISDVGIDVFERSINLNNYIE